MNQSQKRDYYEILGVSRDATADEIKKAFRKLAKEYHPDISSKPNAEEKFKEINEAYQILSNKEKRANYDQFGHKGVDFENGDFSDFGFDFSNIFSGFSDLFNQGNYGHRQENNNSINKYMRINLSFFEAMHGITKVQTIEFEEHCSKCNGKGCEKPEDFINCNHCNGRGYQILQIFGLFNQKTPCNKCEGSGGFIKNKCSLCKGRKKTKTKENLEINIPRGVSSGQHMKFPNKGKVDVVNKKIGDLVIEFKVEKNPIFKREENDLFTDVDISYLDALMGKEISVPTIDGIKQIDINAGTKNNKIIRLKKYGAYNPNNQKQRGHQYLRIKIQLPDKMSVKEKELIKEIDQETKFNPNQKFIDWIKKQGWAK